MGQMEFRLFLKKVPDGVVFDRVHAILLTKDGRVLLRYKDGEPRMTGGRIDRNDLGIEDALEREVLEELNCKIDRCDYLGYIEMFDRTTRQKEYWGRMVARVSEILPPKADPDRIGNWIYGRALAPREIAESEMGRVEVFGKNNVELLHAALETAREKEYFTSLPSPEYEVLNVESRDET